MVIKLFDHASRGICALHVSDAGKSRDARYAEQRLQDWRHELLSCTQAAKTVDNIDDTKSQDDSWYELDGKQEAVAGTRPASAAEIQCFFSSRWNRAEFTVDYVEVLI